MSIKSNIERIKTNVADSFAIIKSYGMEVAVTEKSDSLPTAIGDAFDDVNELLDQINGDPNAEPGGDSGGSGGTSNIPSAEGVKF